MKAPAPKHLRGCEKVTGIGMSRTVWSSAVLRLRADQPCRRDVRYSLTWPMKRLMTPTISGFMI